MNEDPIQRPAFEPGPDEYRQDEQSEPFQDGAEPYPVGQGAGAEPMSEAGEHDGTTERERELLDRVAELEARLRTKDDRLKEVEDYVLDLEEAVMEDLADAEESTRTAQKEATEAQEKLQEYVDKLVAAEQEMEDLRTANETDALTGLANRGALDQALPEAEADPEQEIISFDANGFGAVNKIEEWGPVEGDIQIRRIATAIRLAARCFGVSPRRVFRRGGDEFVAIVPKGTVEYFTRNAEGELVSAGEMSVADAVIRRAVELYKYRRYSGTYGERDEPLSTTISLSGTSGATFAEADGKLQAAKQRRKAELAAAHGS